MERRLFLSKRSVISLKKLCGLFLWVLMMIGVLAAPAFAEEGNPNIDGGAASVSA